MELVMAKINCGLEQVCCLYVLLGTFCSVERANLSVCLSC
jgi:hypothetical protein